MPIALSNEPPKKLSVIQEWVAVICVLGMLAGFMASRALLSISTILLFANVFWPGSLLHTFKSFLKFPFALFSIAFFLVVFIGGMWSENQSTWIDIVTLFLPLLTLPISMLTLPLYKEKYKKVFLVGWYSILLAAIGYSLFQFSQQADAYIDGYKHSKQIPTIKYNDHIRFSLLLALSILPGYSYMESWILNRSSLNPLKIFLIISLIIIIAYLHLLAAKTGLACLYVIIMMLVYDYLKKRGFSKWTFALPPLLILLIGVVGYYTVPTFTLKIQYLIHEIYLVRSGAPLDYNYSSAGRLISYRIATEEIYQHPFFGVGTGDVMQHMRLGYQKMYPEIPAQYHLIPHSQYLYNLLAYGLIFFPVLISMLISPFFSEKTRSRSFLFITTLIFIFSMSFEAMLQVQMGLFIYIFFTCIWYRWDQGADSVLP